MFIVVEIKWNEAFCITDFVKLSWHNFFKALDELVGCKYASLRIGVKNDALI